MPTASPARPAVDRDLVTALVEKAQAGDRQAFGGIYELYADSIQRYICYRTSNPLLAEDLTSETFLRALRAIDTFTWQGRDIGAWLVTIARNLVADYYKSSRHRMEFLTGEMFDPDEIEPSPEEVVLGRMVDEVMLDALARLNEQQRECVTLRFLRGYSVVQAADAMDKSVGNLKGLQFRAVRTLRQLLGTNQATLAGVS